MFSPLFFQPGAVRHQFFGTRFGKSNLQQGIVAHPLCFHDNAAAEFLMAHGIADMKIGSRHRCFFCAVGAICLLSFVGKLGFSPREPAPTHTGERGFPRHAFFPVTPF